MKPEDVDIWFRINNIIPEKMDLYYDFTFSLYYLIVETYLGDDNNGTETKINITDEDKKNHFQWCWKKTIENFNKELYKYCKIGFPEALNPEINI